MRIQSIDAHARRISLTRLAPNGTRPPGWDAQGSPITPRPDSTDYAGTAQTGTLALAALGDGNAMLVWEDPRPHPTAGAVETAWAMLHRFRRAMVRPDRDLLTGTVEVDESFLALRRRTAKARKIRSSKSHNTEHLVPVVRWARIVSNILPTADFLRATLNDTTRALPR